MNMRLRKLVYLRTTARAVKKKKKKVQNSLSCFRVGNLTKCKMFRGSTIKLCSILSFTTTVTNYISTSVDLH